MPELDGLELCQAIRSMGFSQYIYIIMLTGKESKADIVVALEAGADEYLIKPADAEELIARLNAAQRILKLETSLKERAEEVKFSAITDHLTGAFNCLHSSEQLCMEVRRSFKYQLAISLIMCDLDNFKKINDSYGHLVGDLLLKGVGERLRGSIRNGIDWIGRYGDDEFLIVLPNVNLSGASIAAERLRALISEEVFNIRNKQITATASFGVSGIDPNDQSCPIPPELLIEQADRCLYRAKELGKNRVETYTYQEHLDRPSKQLITVRQ